MIICSDVLILTLQVKQWEIVTSKEKLQKLAAQLSFKQFKIFHENLEAAEQAKFELSLNQPIPVGFAILDLKMLMYNFHVSNLNG